MSPGLVCRCGRLRTLVLVLEDLSDGHRSLEQIGDLAAHLAAQLPALALGAPALRTLQLVLSLVIDYDELGGMGEWAGGQLAQVWTALEALPNLASLTLGWITSSRVYASSDAAYSISLVLDAAQAGAPAMLWATFHAQSMFHTHTTPAPAHPSHSLLDPLKACFASGHVNSLEADMGCAPTSDLHRIGGFALAGPGKQAAHAHEGKCSTHTGAPPTMVAVLPCHTLHTPLQLHPTKQRQSALVA